jgi:hypothetical protein
MSDISPDFQIVEFEILGVSYFYEGSSRSVILTGGDQVNSLEAEINQALKGIQTQHVPASDQIVDALRSIGFNAATLPRITYTEDQPPETLPPKAIS